VGCSELLFSLSFSSLDGAGAILSCLVVLQIVFDYLLIWVLCACYFDSEFWSVVV
jgi:hypothetical protein